MVAVETARNKSKRKNDNDEKKTSTPINVCWCNSRKNIFHILYCDKLTSFILYLSGINSEHHSVDLNLKVCVGKGWGKWHLPFSFFPSLVKNLWVERSRMQYCNESNFLYPTCIFLGYLTFKCQVVKSVRDESHISITHWGPCVPSPKWTPMSNKVVLNVTFQRWSFWYRPCLLSMRNEG